MKTYSRIFVGFAFSICGSALAYASNDRELLLSAPIEQINSGADTVTLLGQQFHTSTSQLTVGQILRVYGVLARDGSVSDALVQATDTYAANGDPVFIKGVVTNSDMLLGRAQIDGVTIDYTSQLANPDFIAPSAGDVIALAASQPLNKGVLVAFAMGGNAYNAGTTAANTLSVASSSLVAGAITDGPNGLRSSGMNGGGAAAGMNGGGLSSAGMNGGGLSSAGMNGGGLSSAGMNGGGLRTAGMNGGGR